MIATASTRTRMVLLIALMGIGVCVTAADLNYTRSATLIQTEVAKRGAKAVVDELFQDQSTWAQVLKNIETGKAAWIAAAKSLAAGTDAGSSETLDVALFHALDKSPGSVLNATPDNRVEFVCSSNFLNDRPADKSALHAIRIRIHAVQSVVTPSLYAKRDACLEGLRDSEQVWQRIAKTPSPSAPQ